MSQRQEMDSSDLSHKLEACPMTRNSRITQREQSSTQLDLLPDLLILQQSLTLESIVSTKRINQIGLGLQGAVFEMVGKPSVIKKEKPGNEILSSNLRHEYTLHCRVSAAFDRYQIPTNAEVLVPKPLSLVPKEDDAFWNELLPRLPHEYRDRGDSMILQRILPLPKSTRRALINLDCTSKMTEATKLLAEPENKHCLARVYLGENHGTINRKSPLRNFPLYLDRMRDIGIDTIRLASALGNAFAIMHWGAGVNGDDVEFVLGTTAEGPTPVFQKRAVGLFLLDFGQCDAVDLAQDREDVYQAFRGAMVTGDNQYFIPRPTQPALFAAFKEGYVETGNVILVDKGLDSRFDIEEFMQEYEEYAEDFLY